MHLDAISRPNLRLLRLQGGQNQTSRQTLGVSLISGVPLGLSSMRGDYIYDINGVSTSEYPLCKCAAESHGRVEARMYDRASGVVRYGRHGRS